MAYALRSRIDKWNLIKGKAKDIANRTTRQCTYWEEIIINPTSNRGLASKIYKGLKKLNFRESDNPIKIWEQR